MNSQRDRLRLAWRLAQIADKTLTIKRLGSLGGKLTLPAGWSRTETLNQELDLNSNGSVTAVNDDLCNSYQKE